MGLAVVPVALCPPHPPAHASSLAAAARKRDRARQKRAAVSFIPVYPSPLCWGKREVKGERQRECVFVSVERAGIH